MSGNLNISKSKTTYTNQKIIKLTEIGLSICYQGKNAQSIEWDKLLCWLQQKDQTESLIVEDSDVYLL